MTATQFQFITPEIVATGRLKIPIEFDENGEMNALSMATLLFCDLHGREEIERELNEKGEICFIIPAIDWNYFFYKVAGMTRSQWESYIERAIQCKYVDVESHSGGACCIRFCLEVYKLH